MCHYVYGGVRSSGYNDLTYILISLRIGYIPSVVSATGPNVPNRSVTIITTVHWRKRWLGLGGVYRKSWYD